MRLLPQPSPARSWTFVGLYLIALFASLPFVRAVVITLRQQHLLGASVTLLYFAAVAGLVYHIVFDVRLSDKVAFLSLILLAALGGSLILGLSVAEERIHFLQYGLLALMTRATLSWHCRPLHQYLGAIVIAAGAGWLDELVQGVIPDRVYDLRDVGINAVAALLAVVADEALHNRLGWIPQKEDDAADLGR